jgi:hypothetical protein
VPGIGESIQVAGGGGGGGGGGAIALASGVLAADTPFDALTDIFSTSALEIGTWQISASLSFLAAVPQSVDARLFKASGGTIVFEGPSANGTTNGLANTPMSLAIICFAVITIGPVVVKLQAQASGAASALAETLVGGFTSPTGYVAIQVA